jgi:hypothetical protein
MSIASLPTAPAKVVLLSVTLLSPASARASAWAPLRRRERLGCLRGCTSKQRARRDRAENYRTNVDDVRPPASAILSHIRREDLRLAGTVPQR